MNFPGNFSAGTKKALGPPPKCLFFMVAHQQPHTPYNPLILIVESTLDCFLDSLFASLSIECLCIVGQIDAPLPRCQFRHLVNH